MSKAGESHDEATEQGKHMAADSILNVLKKFAKKERKQIHYEM